MGLSTPTQHGTVKGSSTPEYSQADFSLQTWRLRRKVNKDTRAIEEALGLRRRSRLNRLFNPRNNSRVPFKKNSSNQEALMKIVTSDLQALYSDMVAEYIISESSARLATEVLTNPNFDLSKYGDEIPPDFRFALGTGLAMALGGTLRGAARLGRRVVGKLKGRPKMARPKKAYRRKVVPVGPPNNSWRKASSSNGIYGRSSNTESNCGSLIQLFSSDKNPSSRGSDYEELCAVCTRLGELVTSKDITPPGADELFLQTLFSKKPRLGLIPVLEMEALAKQNFKSQIPDLLGWYSESGYAESIAQLYESDVQDLNNLCDFLFAEATARGILTTEFEDVPEEDLASVVAKVTELLGSNEITDEDVIALHDNGEIDDSEFEIIMEYLHEGDGTNPDEPDTTPAQGGVMTQTSERYTRTGFSESKELKEMQGRIRTLERAVQVKTYTEACSDLVVTGTPVELAEKLTTIHETVGEKYAKALLTEWQRITTLAEEQGIMRPVLAPNPSNDSPKDPFDVKVRAYAEEHKVSFQVALATIALSNSKEFGDYSARARKS